MLNFSRRNLNILLPLMCGLALCVQFHLAIWMVLLWQIECTTDQANGHEKPSIPELYSLRSAEEREHATTSREGKCT